MVDLPFSCRCGALKGTLHDVSARTGNHALCFCSSCRAGILFTGGEDPLTDIPQVERVLQHVAAV